MQMGDVMDSSRPKRVLVIEDDDNIATALEVVIGREGLAQDRLASGAGALGAIRETRPDLVLLDVMLPGKSGYEICREVRHDPALGGVKIILMTAGGAPSGRKRSLELGADGFLAKPFDLAELRQELRRLLS